MQGEREREVRLKKRDDTRKGRGRRAYQKGSEKMDTSLEWDAFRSQRVSSRRKGVWCRAKGERERELYIKAAARAIGPEKEGTRGEVFKRNDTMVQTVTVGEWVERDSIEAVGLVDKLCDFSKSIRTHNKHPLFGNFETTHMHSYAIVYSDVALSSSVTLIEKVRKRSISLFDFSPSLIKPPTQHSLSPLPTRSQ